MLHAMNSYHMASFIPRSLMQWQSQDLCLVSTYLESRSYKILFLLIFIVVSLDHFIGTCECYEIFLVSGAAAQIGLGSPQCCGFYITRN